MNPDTATSTPALQAPQASQNSHAAEVDRILAELTAEDEQQPAPSYSTPQPAAPAAPQVEDKSHAEEVDAILAQLMQEGATASPSDEDAPPGSWTWENVKANLAEVPGQIVRGSAEGINAGVDGLRGMAKWVHENIVDLSGVETRARGVEVLKDDHYDLIPTNILPDAPKTLVGGITNDVAQLAVGLVGAGKLIRVAEGATAAAAVGTRIAQGFLADAAVFRGTEENLANFMQKYPSVANPITQFLATSPDDNEAVGRLKNAVSGAVVGAALEGLIQTVKVVRSVTKGDKEGALKFLDEIDAADDAAKQAKSQAPEGISEGTPAKAADDQMDLFGSAPAKEVEAPKDVQGPPAGEPQMNLDLGDVPLNHAPQAVPEMVPGATKPIGMQPVKKIVTLDDEGFQSFIAARDWNKGLFQGEGQAVTTLNTKLIDNIDEVGPTIDAIAETFQKEITKARGGDYVSWKETEALAARIADLTGGKDQVILQQLARDHQNTLQMSARMKAYADFHATVSQKVDDLATHLVDEFGPVPAGYASKTEAMADFMKHTELLANVQAMYGGAKTNLARTFNAFKIGGVPAEKLAGMNPDELFAGGEAAIRAYARRIKAAGGSPKAIAKVTERGFWGNLMKFSQQVWINGILSNPVTHAANVIGSLAHMAYLPTEKMVAGAMFAGTKEGRAKLVEGALEYRGMVSSARDALRLAANAFMDEAPKLDPGVAGLASNHGSMKLSEFYRNPNGTAEWLFNAFSKATNLSSRLMIAEDEFIKQMAYRANVRSRAHTEWRLGGETAGTGLSLDDFVTKRLDNSVDPKTGQGIDEISLDLANRVTFSNNLQTPTIWGTRSLGEIGQRVINEAPYLRFVMPFVRTPTNIGRFMWSRTPGLNLLRKVEMDNLMGKNGPKAQEDLLARTAVGGTMWVAAAGLAAEGWITGSGPADPEQRKILEATGWKPLSIKTVQDDGSVKYISFARMDPFGGFLGIAADLAEASGHLGDSDLEAVASHMGIALANQLKNKSYMTGLSNLLQAIGSPEQRMQKYIQAQVGSWVPSSLHAINSDPYMREAYDVVGELRKRTPGLSLQQDPVRNLFGEKVIAPPAWGPDFVSPFLTGAQAHAIGDQPVTKDWQENVQADVGDELARQSYIHGAKLYVVPKELDGVDLTQFKGKVSEHGHMMTALDRYKELIAQPKPGMPTLREALQKLVVSPAYRNRMTDGLPGEEVVPGTRQQALTQVVGQYRQAAKIALYRENPEVYQQMRLQKIKENQARRGPKPQQADPLSVVRPQQQDAQQ